MCAVTQRWAHETEIANTTLLAQSAELLAQFRRQGRLALDENGLERLAADFADVPGVQEIQYDLLWIERLATVATMLDAEHPLHRANRLLESWRRLAGHVPIHDLLERVFHEANLLARYEAAFPATQSARVRANLTRFVELALEVDAGRYPTLPRFLERVRQLRKLDREGPNQATPTVEGGARVHLLTIHAAKGLESPVVFLADSTNLGNSPPGHQPLVRWPAEADRPSDFMLLGNTRQRDAISKGLHELERQEEHRVLLIIDEAQNLSTSALEEIRLLSNLEAADAKLLQIILVGQPELKKAITCNELRQLRQRISIHCQLAPLTQNETKDYVYHRLETAGNREALMWGEGTFDALFEYSQGIPRLINIFCDFILLAA